MNDFAALVRLAVELIPDPDAYADATSKVVHLSEPRRVTLRREVDALDRQKRAHTLARELADWIEAQSHGDT